MITNAKGDFMPKNRIFKFTGGEEIKEVTALGWKKAVKSFQDEPDNIWSCIIFFFLIKKKKQRRLKLLNYQLGTEAKDKVKKKMN